MIDTSSFIKSIQQKFSDSIKAVDLKSEKRATVLIDHRALLKIANFFYSYMNFRFIIASAVHTKHGLEIYYHFSNDAVGLVINIHVILPIEKPQIESLANMFEAANWIEREMHELFGITFLNHPNPEALLSDGNWATGVYPLRKDAKELKIE
jgi:Ni,Fe-hydrogenase III component G